MKVKIDKDSCTGCGLCVNSCPDVYEMQGDVAEVKVDLVPESAFQRVKESVENCPLNAISIEE